MLKALHGRIDDAGSDLSHARLAVRYGSRWSAMWAGVPMEAVKADWAQCLEGMTSRAIRYALDNLPDERPPTVAQFKKLCLQGLEQPEPYRLRIADKGDPIPPAVMEKLKALRACLTAPRVTAEN